MNLADAYFEIEEYQNAIANYKEALDGNFQNNFYVIKNMMEAFYKIEDYNSMVGYGKKIVSHPEFTKSRTQFFTVWHWKKKAN